MSALLGRFEENAAAFYTVFQNLEENFENMPMLKMSKLTNNLLNAIDFCKVRTIRTKNFNFLYKNLKNKNILKLKKVKGAYMYPLYLEDAVELKKFLLENKIYIPILWPNVLNIVSKDSIEYKYVHNILPLPCDQRYSKTDMKYICDKIIEFEKRTRKK